MREEEPVMIDLDTKNVEIRMKAVGVGGGGGSVLWRLAEDRVPNIELIDVDSAELNLAGPAERRRSGKKRRKRRKPRFAPR